MRARTRRSGLPIRFITPTHAPSNNMFLRQRRGIVAVCARVEVLHAESDGHAQVRTFIIVSFAQRTILIGGTRGEHASVETRSDPYLLLQRHPAYACRRSESCAAQAHDDERP